MASDEEAVDKESAPEVSGLCGSHTVSLFL